MRETEKIGDTVLKQKKFIIFFWSKTTSLKFNLKGYTSSREAESTKARADFATKSASELFKRGIKLKQIESNKVLK